MKIKPVEGRLIRDPITMKMVTSEIEVPNDIYWTRRVRDGDIALVEENS